MAAKLTPEEKFKREFDAVVKIMKGWGWGFAMVDDEEAPVAGMIAGTADYIDEILDGEIEPHWRSDCDEKSNLRH